MEAVHTFKTSRTMPTSTQCKEPESRININHGILLPNEKLDEPDSLFYEGFTMKQF
jgi:hypothetical protein